MLGLILDQPKYHILKYRLREQILLHENIARCPNAIHITVTDLLANPHFSESVASLSFLLKLSPVAFNKSGDAFGLVR